MEEVKDSSQNSDLGKEELDKIEAQAQAEKIPKEPLLGVLRNSRNGARNDSSTSI